ncbi:MAG: hypothetical protein A3F83_07430 [Candidatus Glassbacteria bacterium RIFCSPLOWO2_12_FULL_58_11]|uniref:Uncharacterized protein n=1 Tax=Candidatus Glassbacteria bacterium RIFCSPLOWO2_12_FULL_58_11 TaxID=1817867 RepID=A0A1F5YLB8_9BACT|nr:MAG: hypothetical protein A3F83_07430 [Candidatus Glassbacteria bacterium RIFCSPLOWO2_12_FULL_58_11]
MQVKHWSAFLFATLAFPIMAEASERLELSTDAAIVSKYVWRGIVVTDGAVVQPAVTVAYGGLSLNVWGNYDLDNVNSTDYRFTEADYTLDYTLALRNVSLSLGSIVYDFPNTGYHPTTELYLGAGLQSFLNPSLTFYKDTDEADGSYLLLSLEHSFPLEDKPVSFDFQTGVGFSSSSHSRYYYSASGSTLSDFHLGLAVPFTARENLTLVPGLYYSALLHGAMRSAADKPDNVIFSLSVSSSF